MEPFTGDRQIPVEFVIGFTDTLTPFPVTTDDILIPNPTVEIQHSSISLPQKLRPIRSNGRYLTEYSDDSNGGLNGILMSSNGGVSSNELEFLTQLSTPKLCFVNEETSGGVPRNGGGNAAAEVVVQQMKSEMEAECMKLISQARSLGAELSSSSDDGDETYEDIREPLNPKRKRKTRKKLELFVDNMMNEVMQKQEQMHKQLIDMIEKKEQERIMREDNWKQQEIERAKRDEVVRAQETSRSLALISFIQNLLGHEIQIPKSFEISFPERDEGEIHNQEDFRCDPNNRRWPKSEVQALITVRTALDHKFLTGPKCTVWQEVSARLSDMGYSRTAKKCKEKWENINKYYKRAMENGKKRLRNTTKECSYFHELEVLYKSGLVNPGNASDDIKNESEDKSLTE